ncbi:hypothetical protein [Planotetraspora kaengkrachanensis]|nr:hypothetical protein [Planotetraspora kaengkrachanensis]
MLLFGCDMDVRATAGIVGRALGMRLEELRNDQLGVAFDAEDPAGGFIFVSENTRRFDESDEEHHRVDASRPEEPTRVYVHATSRADAIVAALTDAGLRLHDRAPWPPADEQLADAAWKRLLLDLRDRGWEVTLTGPAAPLQLEGRLPSGQSFFYHCRYDTCSLGIGGEDPVSRPDWEGEQVVDGGEYAASYIEPDNAVRILLALHADWKLDFGNSRR